MSEIIIRGNSYFKEVVVTTEEDGEEYPVDLTNYTDNYFSISTCRGLDDSEAVFFDKISSPDPENGILTINLTPNSTSQLPLTDKNLQYLYGFVQIGSVITGQVHEVSSFKIKTKDGGISHITPIDKSYDVGPITETVGWVFDAGCITETVSFIENFGGDNGRIIFNAGSLNCDTLKIENFGRLDLTMPEIIDFGRLSYDF